MNNKNNEILIDIEFFVKTSIYNVFITKRMIFINDSKFTSKRFIYILCKLYIYRNYKRDNKSFHRFYLLVRDMFSM
jgi:hypothetical protein